MAGGAPATAAPRRQSVAAARERAMLPHVPRRAPTAAATTLAFVLLIITCANAEKTTSRQLYVVCWEPKSNVCVYWTMTKYSNDRIFQILLLRPELLRSCGLSDLKPIGPHMKFIKVRSSQELDGSGFKFCKISNMIIKGDFTFQSIEKEQAFVTRTRRQTNFAPRGKYRGQTQSQYLSIDHGNGKGEGKAEAHSAADSSRASVSGNSGMGQAQSQTIYDPGCEDCVRRPEQESQYLKRPINQPSAVGGNGGLYPGGNEGGNGPGGTFPGQRGIPGQGSNYPGQGGFNAPGNYLGRGGSGVNYPRQGANPVQGETIGPIGSFPGTSENSGVGGNYPGSGVISGPGGNFPGTGGSATPGGNNLGIGGSSGTGINYPSTGGNYPGTGGSFRPGENNSGMGGSSVPGGFYPGAGRTTGPAGNYPSTGRILGTQGPFTGTGTTSGGPYSKTDSTSSPGGNYPKMGGTVGSGGNSPVTGGYSGPQGTYPGTEAVRGRYPGTGGSSGPGGNFQVTGDPGQGRITAPGTSSPGQGEVMSQRAYPGQIPIGQGVHYPGIGGSGGPTQGGTIGPDAMFTGQGNLGGIYPQDKENTGPGSIFPSQDRLGSNQGLYPSIDKINNGVHPNQGAVNQGGINLGGGPSKPHGSIGNIGYGPNQGNNLPNSQDAFANNWPFIRGKFPDGTYYCCVVSPNGKAQGLGPIQIGNGVSSPPNNLIGPAGQGQVNQFPGQWSNIVGGQGPVGQGISDQGKSVPNGISGPNQGVKISSDSYPNLGSPGGQGANIPIGVGGIPPTQNGQGGSGSLYPNQVGVSGSGGTYPGQDGSFYPIQGSTGGLSMTNGRPGGIYTRPDGERLPPNQSGINAYPIQGITGQGSNFPNQGFIGQGISNYPNQGGTGGLSSNYPNQLVTGQGSNVPNQGVTGQGGGKYPNQGFTGQSGSYPNQSVTGQSGNYPNQGGTGQNGNYPNQGVGGVASNLNPGTNGEQVGTYPYHNINGQGGNFPNQGIKGQGGNYPTLGETGRGSNFPNQDGTGGQGGLYPTQGIYPGFNGQPGSYPSQGTTNNNQGFVPPGSITHNGGQPSGQPGGQSGGQYGAEPWGSNMQPGSNYRSGGQTGSLQPSAGTWNNQPGYDQGSGQGVANQLSGTPGGTGYGNEAGTGSGTGGGSQINGVPQNVLDPNLVASIDDDSEALASVAQADNGTTASASSKGGNAKGRAQTNVQGTYTGSGSFSAQAQISDENKAAESEVTGGKKGASSKAQGSGRTNKSQASVQLGSETGSIQTHSQSDGSNHFSNSQVQGSVKGGMADSQARGPGITSSQAQIGFTPYKEGDKLHDLFKSPFVGSGTSSAHSTGRIGQSQSQLHGTFKYGITYNGAAQAGASLDKDAVFPNRLPYDKIDVFDEKEKNLNVNTETPPEIPDAKDSTKTTSELTDDLKNSESRYTSHVHADHHKETHPMQTPAPVGNKRSFQHKYGTNNDYEYKADREDNPDDYDPETTLPDSPDEEQGEYYDDLDNTHQSLQRSNSKKGLEIKQNTGGNSQHILLGALKNQDAYITQRSSVRPDENRVYQPGERIPGTGGYTIPIGFTGSVKSVASKDNTFVIGSKDSPSQAQSVSLRPGVGKVRYTYPSGYSKNVPSKDLRSLHDDNRYVSVSKSVTRALDSKNNIQKQYSHTYYTKSSSCGYFTFTCTMVSGPDGKKKVCKPKIPTNPDGTPMRC